MIFLTVGTHQPFDRLVRAVDAWCAASEHHDVFGQITKPAADGYAPRHFDWVDTLSPADYKNRFGTADLIVAHAGMGSIITALTLAKPILILPRRAHLGETRNDHQVPTAERFGSRPNVFVANTEDDVAPTLDRLMESGLTAAPQSVGNFAEERLVETVRSFIFGREPGN